MPIALLDIIMFITNIVIRIIISNLLTIITCTKSCIREFITDGFNEPVCIYFNDRTIMIGTLRTLHAVPLDHVHVAYADDEHAGAR